VEPARRQEVDAHQTKLSVALFGLSFAAPFLFIIQFQLFALRPGPFDSAFYSFSTTSCNLTTKFEDRYQLVYNITTVDIEVAIDSFHHQHHNRPSSGIIHSLTPCKAFLFA
jgi:hypothetical protein